MYKYLLMLKLILVFSLVNSTSAQQKDTQLTLEKAFEYAVANSLDGFIAKRQYGANFWQLRAFKARLLPQLNLELQPIEFNRAVVQRFDPARNVDVFRQQQNFSNVARLSLNQNVLITGARVFVSSSFNRLVNFGENRIENYNVTPISVGIDQPIMAFNELKWRRKTLDLEYEQSKKEYISSVQQIHVKTIDLFFNWALANNKLRIAKENKTNAVRLYDIGQKRYDLGAIAKDDLLNLELETYTTNTKLAQAGQELQAVLTELQIFLDVKDLSDYTPMLPELIPNLKINPEEAKELMLENNPESLGLTIREIEAKRDLQRAIKENRFDLSINAQYGLNQQASELSEAYKNPLDQQIVSVQFSMPILDWGERKGNIETAKMNKELSDIEVRQSKNGIIQDLIQKVNNFNLQEDLVTVSQKSRDISRASYEIAEGRFATGKIDLIRFLNSRTSWQSASDQYIQSLQQFWKFYYELQGVTLYNFIDRIHLKEDFENILNN